MVEEVILEEEENKLKGNPYAPVFNKRYVTMHVLILRIALLLMVLAGFVIGYVIRGKLL